MRTDLTGLGDLDVEEIDRRQREELRHRNPNNLPEVALTNWTFAQLICDDGVARTLVCGTVTECFTEDYQIGDIVCSSQLLETPPHPGRRICVSQKLRYECKGQGKEVSISQDELRNRLSDPNADIEDLRRYFESGGL